MPEEPITFEFIRKIQREELKEPKLSKIPEDFYEKAKAYLEEKRKLSEKQKDRNASLEVKNAEGLLEDIFNRRETKIMHQAIITTRTDIPPQNLLKQEEEFFETIVNALKGQREMVLNTLFKKTKEEKFETLKFTEEIPEFVGVDLKKYGPFKEGDEAKIPKENAELFKKVGKAKSMKGDMIEDA
jgi:DNA replication initiation complex subunit (GINS family)